MFHKMITRKLKVKDAIFNLRGKHKCLVADEYIFDEACCEYSLQADQTAQTGADIDLKQNQFLHKQNDDPSLKHRDVIEFSILNK